MYHKKSLVGTFEQFLLCHFNINFYNPNHLKLKAKSEMLSRHLKLFSWTLSFPENLFKNSMAFYVEDLEKNFDEFIKKKKCSERNSKDYCILLYTTCRIVVFMIKHISIVVADRKTKGRKSMLIEREDRI